MFPYPPHPQKRGRDGVGYDDQTLAGVGEHLTMMGKLKGIGLLGVGVGWGGGVLHYEQ